MSVIINMLKYAKREKRSRKENSEKRKETKIQDIDYFQVQIELLHAQYRK